MPQPLTLWLSVRHAAEIAAAARASTPLETGGVLLGYHAGRDLVVTEVVGPGPTAKHTSTSFVPDLDYQHRAIAETFHNSGGTETYLGDWHTHPHGSLRLSKKDLRALRMIARAADAQTPQPVMLLVAGHGDAWRYAAWQLRPLPWLPPARMTLRRY